MSQLMQGKKGIIFGVGNKHSIAYGIAKHLHEQGASLAFTYAGEVMEKRVRPIADSFGSTFVLPCDVTKDHEIDHVFRTYQQEIGQLDFIVHSVAYAKGDELEGDFSDTSRDGFSLALDISAYSLIPMAKWGKKLMPNGGSILALTYLGGERSVPFYNVMGVAKAALESSVRYLAAELGKQQIRVNALSAGPIKTLAGKGIHGFDILLKVNKVRAPLNRNITLDEVGKSGLYLLSDLSTAVTGETHHVDCGAHCIALCPEDAKLVE